MESCIAKQCSCELICLFFPSFFCFRLRQSLVIRVSLGIRFYPLHCRWLEVRARIRTRTEKRIAGRIGRTSGRIARILERQRDGRRGDMSRRGSRLRSRLGRVTASRREREREIEKKSRFLGTWRTSTGSTKRFRSFDIPNSPSISCSFCRQSALSPSAALKKTCFCARMGRAANYATDACRCLLTAQEGNVRCDFTSLMHMS